MKILLTAPPNTGKSTVIQKFLKLYERDKYGFITLEMRDKKDQRVGFKAVNMENKEKVFMHISDIDSEEMVGNKYYVDIKAINNFIVPEIEKGINQKEGLVIIDEIGRAESKSSEFILATRKLINSKSNVLGTILLDDEPWAKEFKLHSDVLIISVTIDNRDYLPKILKAVFQNSVLLEKLNKVQKEFIINEFIKFIQENQLIQAKKLFDNAILYVSNNLVKKIKDDLEIEEYTIQGKTNNHTTLFNRSTNSYSCDCDLFNGRGEFEKNAGECSHIEAIKIARL